MTTTSGLMLLVSTNPAAIGCVRTRFAPQPSGRLWLPAARTALYASLFAKRHGGTLEVRIHDADRPPATREQRDALISGLAWLGIQYEDGVRSLSHRQHVHRQAVAQLIKAGHAYTDRSNGAVYMRVPNTGVITVSDPVQGETTVSLDGLTDFAIQRRGGAPRYDLAVAVDDRDKGITHVFKGVDHLPIHTPRQILLLQALESPPPVYVHLPNVLAPGGTEIRTGRARNDNEPSTVEELRGDSHSPEAVRKYLLTIGLARQPATDLSERETLAAQFSLATLASQPVTFDRRELPAQPSTSLGDRRDDTR